MLGLGRHVAGLTMGRGGGILGRGGRNYGWGKRAFSVGCGGGVSLGQCKFIKR